MKSMHFSIASIILLTTPTADSKWSTTVRGAGATKYFTEVTLLNEDIYLGHQSVVRDHQKRQELRLREGTWLSKGSFFDPLP
jgi:hypothetical protein